MKALNLIIATIVAVLGATFVSAPAFADFLPSEASRHEQVDSLDRVITYLTSDQYIASRLELRKYSADVVSDLISIATAANQSDNLRARAIECLSLYGQDGRVALALSGLLDSLRSNHRLYPDVIIAFATVSGEDSVERLEQLANHPSSQVRMASVIALGLFGGQAGYDLLHELAITEQDENVQARIRRYVR
jgi:HEAT repeat protein